ncbi:hypothetical protein DFH08DRAFT_916712 [Mycena albidolilacea]|uniref:Uncharacterized protein n=1 Tax=Mycena albidolilacea TaxID=1033008 RepID=A0AAD7EJC4_9AGAR|nr:hypothetical protein DFH08DRAFT_916712 [Mycena albidolilacea]
MAERPAPTDPHPWKPFRSELDFEVAEFCELNMLNRNSTGMLISLIRRCMFNPDSFTLTSQHELDELWELASHKCTPFEKGSVMVTYKKVDKTYDTYTRPLWNWALSLIQDPNLATCFVWDAEKAYKFNGESYVQFYHEPWTADAFWAAQVSLPDDPGAKAVCFLISADKSKLSSFGSQKAYAVVAGLANITADIRNSTRFGGSQIVGHQPIVKDDPNEKDKPAFSNFKNIVWHAALYKLLESIVDLSKVGHWTPCGDDVLRWLFPRILILAADYEEVCVMALIRGLQGLYPCPIYLSTEHPLRTSAESQQIIATARAKRTKEEREEHLKDHGLRDIDNVFWKIAGSDPYKAISYDPLHADDGGFWGDHLFAQIKALVEELGRQAIVQIDSHNLNHFETVMNTSFNDGSKHEDIAKMMLFVAHNVLDDDAGLLLLQALRKIHCRLCGNQHEEKNWNFPKMHARRHAFQDIKNKGAVRNFGTKPSESMHRPLRETYHRMTNFKDVTPQLVKHDHRRTVAMFVREQIDALNKAPADTNADSPDDLEASVLSNIDIGSKLRPVSFAALEDTMSKDSGFQRFRVKFGTFISDFLPAFGYTLPNGKPLSFDKDDTVVPFQFLTVHYDSLSTWTPKKDLLRCNPKFNNHPRYNYVMVKTEGTPIFARLLYMFLCRVEQKFHPFALILPFDAPTGHASRKDKALRFRRVKSKLRKESEFISVHSIIRGAVLVPDSKNPGEFLVIDILDTDTSPRLKTLYPRDHM